VLSKFTERAQCVVARAYREAYARNNDYLGTAHLLLGLLHDSDVARMLQVLGADPRVARRHIEHTIGPVQRSGARDLPVTPQARKTLERGLREAQRRGHHPADAEHILYGLISDTDSAAAKALTIIGARPARILERLVLIWGPPNPAGQT
jgi:ATP-dependent Clp protease ATP-binding subunit ClpC